jgi:hypothetical protein
MGGTNDPPERIDDQDDDLKAGEEVREPLLDLQSTISSAPYLPPEALHSKPCRQGDLRISLPHASHQPARDPESNFYHFRFMLKSL